MDMHGPTACRHEVTSIDGGPGLLFACLPLPFVLYAPYGVLLR